MKLGGNLYPTTLRLILGPPKRVALQPLVSIVPPLVGIHYVMYTEVTGSVRGAERGPPGVRVPGAVCC